MLLSMPLPSFSRSLLVDAPLPGEADGSSGGEALSGARWDTLTNCGITLMALAAPAQLTSVRRDQRNAWQTCSHQSRCYACSQSRCHRSWCCRCQVIHQLPALDEGMPRIADTDPDIGRQINNHCHLGHGWLHRDSRMCMY